MPGAAAPGRAPRDPGQGRPRAPTLCGIAANCKGAPHGARVVLTRSCRLPREYRGGKGGRCRLPQHSQDSVVYQPDAFYSGIRTEPEQGRNKPSHCKTARADLTGANENPGALAGATGVDSKSEFSPLFDSTPGNPDQGPVVIGSRHGDGWRIGLVGADGRYTCLRILPYGHHMRAVEHTWAFARYYGVKNGGVPIE